MAESLRVWGINFLIGKVDLPSKEQAERAHTSGADSTLTLGQSHPLAALSGKYNDADWWDEYLQGMEEYRAGLNANDPLG